MSTASPGNTIRKRVLSSDDPTKSLTLSQDDEFNNGTDCIICGKTGTKRRKVISNENGMNKIRKVILGS